MTRRKHIAKALRIARDTWAIRGIALLLLLIFEGIARVIVRPGREVAPDKYLLADSTREEPWIQEYTAEFRKSQETHWESYVYWRRNPVAHALINVDTDGIRQTIQTLLETPINPTPLKVLVFGGSTAWGSGARDAHTIPSAISRELAQRGIASEVINLGEMGYVSTQETIALMLALREGTRPDVVVFYDGANDVEAAWQRHLAGDPQNEANREREFRLINKSQRGRLVKEAVVGVIQDSGLHALLAGAKALRSEDEGKGKLPREEFTRVANEIVAVYAANQALIDALANDYGFEPFYYWQPMIYDKPLRTDFERDIVENNRRDDFFRLACDQITAQQSRFSAQRFRSLRSVFAEEAKPLFSDFCHISEAGNAVIAREIASDIASWFERSGAQPPANAPKDPLQD